MFGAPIRYQAGDKSNIRINRRAPSFTVLNMRGGGGGGGGAGFFFLTFFVCVVKFFFFFFFFFFYTINNI